MSRSLFVAIAATVAAGCSHGGSDVDLVTVRLKALPAPGHRLTQQDLDRAAAILRERVKKLGAPKAELTIERPLTTRAAIDPQTSAPVVVFRFTPPGRALFRRITRREAQRGALACGGRQDSNAVLSCAQHFVIVLDREIVSAPYIDFVRNPDGIPADNGAQVDLGAAGSLRDAKRIAIALQTGALPVRLVRLP